MDITNFNELNISAPILRALAELGYESPTPIQQQAIPLALERKDIIGLAQTGTGKTCAFGLPLLEQIDVTSDKVQAVVVAPTRELAMQITNELRKYSQYMEGIRMLTIYGGESIEKQILALKKRPQIIVGTPGRIMDHMRRRTLRFQSVSMVVLDEADEMLNMGFKEDIDTILADIPEYKQMMMFSATFPAELMEIAKNYQVDPVTINVRSQNITSQNIRQCVIETVEANKAEIVSRILDGNSYRICLVFCNTKKRVDELAEYLHIHGYRVNSIHGDMKQKERDYVMNLFRKSQLDVLVATDVAARGIDVDHVDAVISYDVPEDEEYYVHRIGRCGRAGREGVSYLLANKRQRSRVAAIEKMTKVKMEEVPIPTATQIKERRVDILIEEILSDSLVVSGEMSECIDVLSQRSGMSLSEISEKLFALLLKKSFPEVSDSGISNFDVEPGYVRLYINLGNQHHASPASIIKCVAANTGVSGKHFGAIDISGHYSYFEIPEKFKDKVLGASGTFEAHSVHIEIAEEVQADWKFAAKKKGNKPSRRERKNEQEDKKSSKKSGKKEESKSSSRKSSARDSKGKSSEGRSSRNSNKQEGRRGRGRAR
ncbi:MAG: DEAD/DEAH box helicase [Erysipelotrichaceae bacterium]|nr:DEAD/DEAH box helicase [Erysipelotrichaceae bacterium]